jgi:hypothetical protein
MHADAWMPGRGLDAGAKKPSTFAKAYWGSSTSILSLSSSIHPGEEMTGTPAARFRNICFCQTAVTFSGEVPSGS